MAAVRGTDGSDSPTASPGTATTSGCRSARHDPAPRSRNGSAPAPCGCSSGTADRIHQLTVLEQIALQKGMAAAVDQLNRVAAGEVPSTHASHSIPMLYSAGGLRKIKGASSYLLDIIPH